MLVLLSWKRFNTSHVTLYLFSSFFSFRTSCRFNTSHVTLYLCCLNLCIYIFKVSIHLMLLFIEILIHQLFKIFAFQYISCYSLSNARRMFPRQCIPFQYISCYSLSIGNVKSHYASPPFQYISCYSLSLVL